LSTRIDRAVLSVPAFPFSMLVERNVVFQFLFELMNRNYPRKMDQLLLLQIWGLVWEQSEPGAYTDRLLTNTFPGRPAARTVLFYVSVNDDMVSNLGTFTMMRTAGVPQVEPTMRDIFGVATVAMPFDGSALVDFDCKRGDPIPTGNYAIGSEHGGHDCPSTSEPVHLQIGAFLWPDGVIEQTCDGPCDPD
jgi:hypothetical protein